MEAKPTSGAAHTPPDLSSLCLSIGDHAPLPMAAVEADGHIVRYVNPAFCRLIGKKREQLLGKPFCEMLPETDRCAMLLDRVLRTGSSESHVEEEHSTLPPAFRSYTMWPMIAAGRRVGIMIQVMDIAQLHEKTLAMNEALMLGSVRQHEITGQFEGLVTERTAQLTATNKQLEAFVYSIAHDLRAPLRAMQGFSAMLVEEAGATLNEAGREYAERIDKSAQFMDALLIDLLAFSRIGQQRIELTPVDLKRVVEGVLARLQPDIREKNARVESPGPWPIVLAHEPTLAQVLFNLASNALKFVADDVPPLLRLRTEEQAQFIRVWVEDNGVGIAPDHQGQIFRLFTRLFGEKYPGTGIGLAIVQKGVERMGGQVGVESVPGQGSRFWFELKKA